MQVTGILRKMHTSADKDGEVHYQLPVGEHTVALNQFIGQQVALTFNQSIFCTHCGRKTKKSFNQGYCFPCLQRLAQCDTCIIKPELCHYAAGTCREPLWGEEHCLQPHFVYLANTGNAKVGITRHISDGISSRWMDQGASQACVMFKVASRKLSGEIETLCKPFINDKTNWRAMLKGEPLELDLTDIKVQLLSQIEPQLTTLREQYGADSIELIDDTTHQIRYPVLHYPTKIQSLNLDKQTEFSGTLTGIKGQYWLLDESRVINIRKFAGYEVDVKFD